MLVILLKDAYTFLIQFQLESLSPPTTQEILFLMQIRLFIQSRDKERNLRMQLSRKQRHLSTDTFPSNELHPGHAGFIVRARVPRAEGR